MTWLLHIKKILKSIKGFTFIELLIVMSLIGGLTVMAAPNFIGQTDRAHMAGIRNDIMILESKVGELAVLNPTKVEGWPEPDGGQLERALAHERLYNRHGLIIVGEHTEQQLRLNQLPADFVEDELKTYLSGTFFSDDKGQIYYEETPRP